MTEAMPLYYRLPGDEPDHRKASQALSVLPCPIILVGSPGPVHRKVGQNFLQGCSAVPPALKFLAPTSDCLWMTLVCSAQRLMLTEVTVEEGAAAAAGSRAPSTSPR